MAPMLAKSARRHAGHECRFAGRGCTCFYFHGAMAHPRQRGKLRALQRRQARAAEARAWRADARA
ncbi:hypothetical protein [Streptomyces javensis]|uniref:C3H1-type domain-containing protein n=1 Tax=Streptomyces javensis TaxID=114698 RepID=A0ABS0RNU4_9ACTN|nr:hypothetical protein [Streptomyces javensis]MBI0319112.1 hypothetical protein [Streptomyces javensis]